MYIRNMFFKRKNLFQTYLVYWKMFLKRKIFYKRFENGLEHLKDVEML